MTLWWSFLTLLRRPGSSQQRRNSFIFHYSLGLREWSTPSWAGRAWESSVGLLFFFFFFFGYFVVVGLVRTISTGSSPLSSLVLECFIIPCLVQRKCSQMRAKVRATERKSFKAFGLISKKTKNPKSKQTNKKTPQNPARFRIRKSGIKNQLFKAR